MDLSRQPNVQEYDINFLSAFLCHLTGHTRIKPKNTGNLCLPFQW